VGKRAELPKADAFFGGSAQETVAVKPEATALLVTEAPTSLKEDEALAETPTERAKERGRGMPAAPEQAVSDVRASTEEAPSALADTPADVEKVTLYLPPDIIKQLEVARVDLLLRYGTKVNRSQIAAVSLRQTLEELAQRTAVGDRLVAALVRG
jgi:hypothetical protein